MDDGVTWKNFNSGAVLVGTYSSNATVNVSQYGATSANQFKVVCYQSKSTSMGGGSGIYFSTYSLSFTAPSLSLSGNTLTVNVGKAKTQLDTSSTFVQTLNIPVQVYYVG